MPEALKVLGQTVANVETDLYVVPANTQTIVSTITVCNRSDVNQTFRLSVARNGEATIAEHYIYYDANIGAKVTVAITIGMTLDAADVIRTDHSGGVGDVVFNAFGTEIS